MITRCVQTIADVKHAIAGYKLLFNHVPNLLLTGDGVMYDGNDPIFERRSGFPVLAVGTKTITIEVDGQPCRIRPDTQHCPLFLIFD